MVNLVRHHEDALAPEGELDADRGLVGGEGIPQLEALSGALLEDSDRYLWQFLKCYPPPF